MGFRSALSFFKHLAERDGVSVHYPQYKRIELGTVLPQADFVRRVVKVLPEYSRVFVKAYCADLFPEMTEIFENSPSEPMKVAASSGLLHAQEELTVRQVAAIAKSQFHYAAYLLLTLARRPVSLKEIQVSIKGIEAEVLDELIKAKIIFCENECYKARVIERRFPSGDSRELKSAYLRLDEWDASMGQVFRLDPILDKSIFRRVSPRYVPVLFKMAETLVDQSRASDEVDPMQNTEVMSLVIRLQKGSLPG